MTNDDVTGGVPLAIRALSVFRQSVFGIRYSTPSRH
jgi:hypothetical protein